MTSTLRILHLEDDPADAEIIQAVLEGEGIVSQVTRVESRDDFVAALESERFDVILADFSLPSFDGLSALKIATQKRPDVPFIFVSGTLGEEVAIEALKIGATDYVLKQRLSRIVSSVRRALRDARDRAEREQAELQLRRSEAFLAEGQRISHTGSFGWNVRSGELHWSHETHRIFELDRAATPTIEFVLRRTHPDDLAFVQETLRCATREEVDLDFEHRLLMPDGSVKHIHVLAPALKAASGSAEFIGTVIDITERKLAEDEKVRLEQRLRQAEKMEALGRFAGGIAHDFNNVLHGILGYGEMLLQETPEGSPLRRYAQNVHTAATLGHSLVDQILEYSRTQHGKRVRVGLSRVVAETLELVRGSLPAGIRLEASAPESPLAVIGDETQLHRVVMNLCSNAIQAMKAGGTLRVVLEADDIRTRRTCLHGALGPGRYVRLAVSDSGSGMDAAMLARIFEPFFTTKESGRGTGLGLSLVYAIVTDADGAIDVQSTPGHGSTFTIHLPLADAAVAVARVS
jgi:signal transduction histidine kinase